MLVKFYECLFFNFDDYDGFDDGDGGGLGELGFWLSLNYRAREGNVRAPPRYFAG